MTISKYDRKKSGLATFGKKKKRLFILCWADHSFRVRKRQLKCSTLNEASTSLQFRISLFFFHQRLCEKTRRVCAYSGVCVFECVLRMTRGTRDASNEFLSYNENMSRRSRKSYCFSCSTVWKFASQFAVLYSLLLFFFFLSCIGSFKSNWSERGRLTSVWKFRRHRPSKSNKSVTDTRSCALRVVFVGCIRAKNPAKSRPEGSAATWKKIGRPNPACDVVILFWANEYIFIYSEMYMHLFIHSEMSTHLSVQK